ncbi:hypothetical protein MC885_006823 [Smutsia gigantea]|nr:hypothetical protein MC885_006823 [Smutsia gigantea]
MSIWTCRFLHSRCNSITRVFSWSRSRHRASVDFSRSGSFSSLTTSSMMIFSCTAGGRFSSSWILRLLHLPLQLPPPAHLLIQTPAQPAMVLAELWVLLGDYHLLHHHLLLGPPPLQQQVLVLQLIDNILRGAPLLSCFSHLLAEPFSLLLQDGVLLVAHHLLVHCLGFHLGPLPLPLIPLPLQPDELLLGPPTAVDQLVELSLQAVNLTQHLRAPLMLHHLPCHLLVLHLGLLGAQDCQLCQQSPHLLLRPAPPAGGLLQLSPEPNHRLLCLRGHVEGLVDMFLEFHFGLLLLYHTVLAVQSLQLLGQHLILTSRLLEKVPQLGHRFEKARVLLHLPHLLHDHLWFHSTDGPLQACNASLQLGHGCLCPLPLCSILLSL